MELDGSGSLVALDTSGNLRTLRPRGPRDSAPSRWSRRRNRSRTDVTSFTVDGAWCRRGPGDRVPRVRSDDISRPGPPGRSPGRVFAYSTQRSRWTKWGAVVALFSLLSSRRAVRTCSLCPGSTQGQPLDQDYSVASFEIDGSERSCGSGEQCCVFAEPRRSGSLRSRIDGGERPLRARAMYSPSQNLGVHAYWS